MRQKKFLVTGALLLALALLAGGLNLACAWLFPQETKYEVPSYYTTYTDSSHLFSISYPNYWQRPMGEVASFQEYTKKSAATLKSGLPLEHASLLFFAGLDNARTYDPLILVAVEPLTSGALTQRQVVDVEIAHVQQGSKSYILLSRVDATLDGRKATVLTWNDPAESTLHIVEMLMLVDQSVWVVDCATASTSSKWDVDFNTIVRSLQIYD